MPLQLRYLYRAYRYRYRGDAAEIRYMRQRVRRGDTVVVPQTDVEVREQDTRLVQLEEGTTLDAVVRSLNALGATPRDIIAIMQALKASGALKAEIVVL